MGGGEGGGKFIEVKVYCWISPGELILLFEKIDYCKATQKLFENYGQQKKLYYGNTSLNLKNLFAFETSEDK